MKKNIIYVDFLFRRKKVTHINFFITSIMFSFAHYVKYKFLKSSKSKNISSPIKKVQ